MNKDILKINRKIYLDKIRPFYYSDYIKVITGIRRCGKSEILKQIIKDIQNEGVDYNQIIIIDLESEPYHNFKTGKQIFNLLHKRIINKDKYYIFIDEIQHIKNFEIVIAAIRNSYNCSLFVTGSNSKLLHGKLQDRLTGRAKEFVIQPFSYSESLEFKRLNNLPIKSDDFEDYLKWGGMPQRFVETTDDGVKDYLSNLYSSIVSKDIYSQHKKIDKTRFDRISKYIVATSGKFFSSLSLAKYLKNTLKHKDSKVLSKSINTYANHLIESFLICECPSYDIGNKKTLIGSRKFYPTDVGFKNALSNTLEYDKTFALEGIVYNELIYRGYKVYFGKKRDKEIDFVAIKDGKKIYIQVAYKIDSQSTFDREYNVLKSMRDNVPKFVISTSNIKDIYYDIPHINVVDFLTHKVDLN